MFRLNYSMYWNDNLTERNKNLKNLESSFSFLFGDICLVAHRNVVNYGTWHVFKPFFWFFCCYLPARLFNNLTLKAYFQPWCNARRDPISCNTKFPDHWKPSKIVFLKSHPGHIVNCFTVNTFAVRHFTVSLQYFEFCPEKSEEKFYFLWTESAKRTTFKFFHFLEALEDSKWR